MEALRADPQWKKGQCLYSHTVQFQPERHLWSVLISSRTSFFKELFMSQGPRGQLFQYPFQLYEKKNWKQHHLRKQDERYLIL